MLRDAPGLAGDHVGLADAVEEQRLAVVDVAHHGDDRRARAQLVFVVVVVAEQGLELGLLLLARLDEQHVGAHLGREQLDHVVAERHRGRDHLALLEQEPHHVGGGAVELRAEVLGGGAALDDDLALGHRRLAGRVRRELGRLELLEAAPTATAALRARPSPTGAAATAGTAARPTAADAGAGHLAARELPTAGAARVAAGPARAEPTRRTARATTRRPAGTGARAWWTATRATGAARAGRGRARAPGR